MKKPTVKFDLELEPDACYKMEYSHNESKRNYESTTRWLYLGADSGNCEYAKVGLTTGNLSSRSYSSGNPKFYLFCAFKCRYDIGRSQLKRIETGALDYLDRRFTKPDGTTKREAHEESGRLSECYYGINFIEFFIELHYYLYTNHRNDFIIGGFYNEVDVCEGDFLDCIFNKSLTLDETNRYIRMILQF